MKRATFLAFALLTLTAAGCDPDETAEEQIPADTVQQTPQEPVPADTPRFTIVLESTDTTTDVRVSASPVIRSQSMSKSAVASRTTLCWVKHGAARTKSLPL